MLTPRYVFWTLAFNAPIPLAIAFAGSRLVRRVGAPRGVHACGEVLLRLALAWLAVLVLDQIVRHWYCYRPGVTQGDWLPLIDFTTYTHQVLNASAVMTGVVAVLVSRSRGES